MKRYAINVQGCDWSTRVMVEWQLYGAAMAFAAYGQYHLAVQAYVPHWIAFKTDSANFVSKLKLEISNYGLTLEEQP